MLFSRWNWSSRRYTRWKMSLVRMCWSSISRTSAWETAGPMVRRHRSRKDAAAASWYSLVLRLRIRDGGPQVLQHRGQVGLELALSVPELLDLRKLIVQEDADDPVQFPIPGHIHPHRLVAVLD